MGAYKSKCKHCGKFVKAKGFLQLAWNESEHLEKEHPEIYKATKEAELEYQEDLKQALEKKLAKSGEPHFRSLGWKPTEYAEEKRCPKCHRWMEST